MGPTDEDGDTATPMRRRASWQLVVLGLLAGSVLGLAGSAGWWAMRDDGDTADMTLAPVRTGPPEGHLDNARAFLASWQRFRWGTFRLELVITRRLEDGRSVELERLLVQDPPRRVVRQSGSVSALLGEEALTCDTVDDELVCTTGGRVEYQHGVDRELEAWASAFAGDQPTYVVERPDDGCFVLRLARPLPAPPYGQRSRLCFDADSGALLSRRVEREGSTHSEEVVALRTEVTEADFDAALG